MRIVHFTLSFFVASIAALNMSSAQVAGQTSGLAEEIFCRAIVTTPTPQPDAVLTEDFSNMAGSGLRSVIKTAEGDIYIHAYLVKTPLQFDTSQVFDLPTDTHAELSNFRFWGVVKYDVAMVSPTGNYLFTVTSGQSLVAPAKSTMVSHSAIALGTGINVIVACAEKTPAVTP